MKVFISWSGERSKAIAEVLRNWLPAVIQAVQPYYSSDDIAKGARWNAEIAKTLEESSVGLICVTRDCVEAPWVMFEAGALAKNLDKSKVVPILFGVEPTDLTGPLVQFQAARFEKTEMKRVVRTVNNELGEQKLATNVLDTVYETWWPKLKEAAEEALGATAVEEASARRRGDRELLEEVLQLVRSQARRFPARRQSVNPSALRDIVYGFNQLTVGLETGDLEMAQVAARTLHAPINHLLREHGSGLSEGDQEELAGLLEFDMQFVEPTLAEPKPLGETELRRTNVRRRGQGK